MLPLIPISSGIHFNGKTIAEQSSIAVDLQRMNQILEIDSRNRKVKIKPGVTWCSLQKALKWHDQMALPSLLPHPLISALSSILERNPMLIPKYEYADPVLTIGYDKLLKGIKKSIDSNHVSCPPQPIPRD